MPSPVPSQNPTVTPTPAPIPQTPTNPPVQFNNPPPAPINDEPEEEFIPDEEVPQDDQPKRVPKPADDGDEITILDEEIPQADVPQTGDSAPVLMAVILLCGIGLILINRKSGVRA